MESVNEKDVGQKFDMNMRLIIQIGDTKLLEVVVLNF